MPSADADEPPLTDTALPPFLPLQANNADIAIAKAKALVIDIRLFFIVVMSVFLFSC
jgi:hypothetical protein